MGGMEGYSAARSAGRTYSEQFALDHRRLPPLVLRETGVQNERLRG
jgi:hypothetical protein